MRPLLAPAAVTPVTILNNPDFVPRPPECEHTVSRVQAMLPNGDLPLGNGRW